MIFPSLFFFVSFGLRFSLCPKHFLSHNANTECIAHDDFMMNMVHEFLFIVLIYV